MADDAPTPDLARSIDELAATANRLVDGLIVQRDTAREALAEARDLFLDMIAEARRWDADTDGEYVDGVPRTQTFYFAEFNERHVRALVEALGIKVSFDELAGEAIARRLKADAAAAPPEA